MTEQQQELRRLRSIEVEGLFGVYHHRIDLKRDGVTLLHGPNGVGKTSVLKMTDALLTGRLGYFHRVPFRRFLLQFEDNSTLSLSVPLRPLDGEDDTKEDRLPATLELVANGERESALVDLKTHDPASVASRTEQEIPGLWNMLREISPLLVARRSSAQKIPWLSTFLKGAHSHLIEAQRLVRTQQDPQEGSVSIPTVDDCSRDLKRRIDDTVAEYGRQAQALDQSFPQRLLQRSSTKHDLSVEEIKRRMAALDSTTEDLKKIGILDVSPANPFKLGDEIDNAQRGVMALYVEDTAQKHQAAQHLADRIRLLLQGLNGKFRHKRIGVERDRGLVAHDKHGSPLPLAALSSGEQHELVLHYDLLFRIAPNTLVLLDEPEISLHVEWQSTFLADLMKIAKLSGFAALVATHSPHIVGDQDDLMVGLGD